MAWTFDSVKTLIETQENWIVESEGDCLSVSNDEGVDAFVYAGEQQLVVETPLFPLSKVNQPDALNLLVLKTHQLLPLTTIGIKHIGDEDYYVAFGSLSIDSKDTVVLEEIETLFLNVAEFIELYSDYLIQETHA
jgi:uncharacterized protein YjfI (DUF2170 family)